MPLIEREAHLAALAEYLDDARSGSGRFVLVNGEAGAGRSVLIATFLGSVSARAVVGHCGGVATPRPLGPIVEAATKLGLETSLPPEDLFDTIARSLGRRAEHPRDRRRSLGGRCDQRFPDLCRAADRGGRHAAHRDDEIGPDHPLRILLGELTRFSSTRRIAVPRLSSRGVAELVDGTGLDPEEADRLIGAIRSS